MSVRAYIVRKFKSRFEENEIVFEKTLDRSPLFNIWHNPKIFEIFQDYGYDFTNHDCCGEIFLSKSDWLDFKKEFKKEKWGRNELKILEKIDEELKLEDEIWCECF